MEGWILPSNVFVDLQVSDRTITIEVAVSEGLEAVSPLARS